MRKLVVLFFILLSVQLSAQLNPEKVKIGIQSGYAFYGQKDLNSINQDIINQLPFEARIIDDFKPVLFIGAYVQYDLFSRFSVGPAYEYHYTGSRVGVKDYSGIFSFDQYVHTHRVGLKADYCLIPFGRVKFNIEMNAGASFTDWKMDSNLEIGDNGEYSEHQLDKLKGLSWYISPALKFKYRLIPKICFVGAVAYSFDLIKDYHYKENRDIEIVKFPDWSGISLSLGLEFKLK